MTRNGEGLPDGSLRHLAVAEQDPDAEGQLLEELPRERDPDRDRQALTERSRRDIDLRERRDRVPLEVNKNR